MTSREHNHVSVSISADSNVVVSSEDSKVTMSSADSNVTGSVFADRNLMVPSFDESKMSDLWTVM